MKLIIRLVILSLLCFSFSGCAITHKFGPYRGKVVDAETQEPIEGAVVHMDFFSNLITPAGGVSKYIGSREVLTDKEGEFSITQRYWTFRFLNVWTSSPLLCIFKPGFATFPGNSLTSIEPKPHQYPISTIKEHIIKLPKLETRSMRSENLDKIRLYPDASYEQAKYLLDYKNIERENLGFSKIDHRLRN